MLFKRGAGEVQSLEEAVRKAAISSAASQNQPHTHRGAESTPVHRDTGPSLDTAFGDGGVIVSCSLLIGGEDAKIYSGLNVGDHGYLIRGKDGAIAVFDFDPNNRPENPLDHLQKGVNLSRAIVNKTNGNFWINLERKIEQAPVADQYGFGQKEEAPKQERIKASMVLLTEVLSFSVIGGTGEVATLFSQQLEKGRQFLIVGKSGAQISVELAPGVRNVFEFDGTGIHKVVIKEEAPSPVVQRITGGGASPAQGRQEKGKASEPKPYTPPQPQTPPIDRLLVMDRGLKVSCNSINAQGSAILGLATDKNGCLYPFGAEEGIEVFNFSEKDKPQDATRVPNEHLHDVYAYLDKQSGKIALNIGSRIPEEERKRSEGTLLAVSKFFKVIRVHSGEAKILATTHEPDPTHGRHTSAILLNGSAKFVVQERPDGEPKVYAYQGGNFVATMDNPNAAPIAAQAPGAKPEPEAKKGFFSRFKKDKN